MEQPVAVITGSSRGIGRAIALKLASEGCRVVINYLHNAKQAEELQQEIKCQGKSAIIVGADVANSREAKLLIETAISEFGQIDYLVNNAGINQDKLLIRMDDEEWLQLMNINLNAAFYCSRAALKHMIRRKTGCLVHISSVVGISGNPGQSHYSAAKSALLGFSASIAKEYGGRGIRSNVVAPGFIQSDMTAALPEARQKQILAAISLGRAGTPMDAANLVAFLVSEKASYITGQCLRVDGGMSI